MPADAANASQLAAQLEQRLRGAFRGEARFDRLSRAIYATDASLYEISPLGVATPCDTRDVVLAVQACQESQVPLVARGGGTGIAGGALGWGLTLDFSRHMNRVLAIDPAAKRATVQPGVVLDELNAQLAPHGMHFPPDVASASRATIGGMIANNSCGSRSVYYGRTVDYIESLTVVLADGAVEQWTHHPYEELPPLNGMSAQRPFGLTRAPAGAACGGTRFDAELDRLRADLHEEVLRRYPRVLRRNGGYALDRLAMSPRANPATLICGSEGTLGLVVEATLRIEPLPRYRALVLFHFERLLDALTLTPRLLAYRPAAVELVDSFILRAGVAQCSAAASAFLCGDPAAILVLELIDERPDELRERVERVVRDAEREKFGLPVRVASTPEAQAAVWSLRNRGFGLLMCRPGPTQPHEFIEDAAVPPERLADYIAELDSLLAEEGVGEVAHYAHASVGVIHARPALDLGAPADRLKLRRIAERAADLALRYGGALSGEHGDGIVRSEFLERMYGPRIVAAFGEIKRLFDPLNLLNPRKIVDPLLMDQRLRGGGASASLPLAPRFDFGAHRDAAGLAGMCSGVGQCRQKLTGVMCPSYMATLDEMHTTRARANALRTALGAGGLLEGIADEALDEVMDLCLSCKACKTECPTGVDMARLKAEWLYQRARRRGISAQDRFFSEAARAARWGSAAPGLVNLLLRQRPVRAWLERRYGLDRRAPAPALARRTFRSIWKNEGARAAPSAPTRGRVVYFLDTWTNHYWPSAGLSAVRLLRAAGYEVSVPRLKCCGRPMISKGRLDEAAALLRENVLALRDEVARGAWLVGSEPSCILTFIDEAPALLSTDDARVLAARVRTVDDLLAEALVEEPRRLPLRAAELSVRLHGHCHQKSLVGTAGSLRLLSAIPGAEVREINSGCCGMAGSFGHERGHYEVARLIGEQRLFPAVRERGAAQIAVSGFSCREQIAHHTGVTPLHTLEIVAAALEDAAVAGHNAALRPRG